MHLFFNKCCFIRKLLRALQFLSPRQALSLSPAWLASSLFPPLDIVFYGVTATHCFLGSLPTAFYFIKKIYFFIDIREKRRRREKQKHQ